jgi:4-hydroxy-2-oxoglutarate aldolase
MTGINGHSAPKQIHRRFNPGVYAPIPTFFNPDAEESLDIPTFKRHVVHLARADILPVLCGSMGEAIHLLHPERSLLIKSAREALDEAGLEEIPIIAGTGAGSLKETLLLSEEAAKAGADAVIVIASGYFAGAIKDDPKALYEFFHQIAERSPLPLFVYNCESYFLVVFFDEVSYICFRTIDPGASGGIDLDSDLITSIAKHPNVIGCKLTCGNVGKLTRIASVVSSQSFLSSHPRSPKQNPQSAVTVVADQFLVFGGFTDFLTPSIFADAHGAITGLANVAPYACAKLFRLSMELNAVASSSSSSSSKPPTKDLLRTTLNLQGLVAQSDRTLALGGISGTKYVLQKMHGYGGNPRLPLPAIDPKKGEELLRNEWVVGLVGEEARAEKEVKSGA